MIISWDSSFFESHKGKERGESLRGRGDGDKWSVLSHLRSWKTHHETQEEAFSIRRLSKLGFKYDPYVSFQPCCFELSRDLSSLPQTERKVLQEMLNCRVCNLRIPS